MPGRFWSVTGYVLATLIVLGLALTAHPADANPPEEEGLKVELTELSPAVLRPGEDLIIRGTVRNTSPQTVTNPSVRLIMQRYALSSRPAVDAWYQGSSSAHIGTAAPVEEQLEEEVGPGESVTFTLTMPSGPTFAETSSWGPRGVEVAVTGGGLSGSARTMLLWFPEESPLAAPAELSVLVPLTPTNREWRQAITEQIPVAEASAERLLGVLRESEPRSFSWALDPALLETSPPTAEAPLETLAAAALEEDGSESEDDGAGTESEDGDGPEPGLGAPAAQEGRDGVAGGSGEANPGAQDLWDALSAGEGPRDVLQLPYADADLATLAHAEDVSLWRIGQQRGGALLAEAGITPLAGVQWPGGEMDGLAMAALAGEQVETMILPGRALAIGPHASLGAPAHVRTAAGPAETAVADERISALLTGSDPAGAVLDDLTARQLLLADTAAAVREYGSESPGFLATLDRDVTADALTGQLGELAGAPWLELTDLRSLLGRSPVPGTLSAATPARGDITRLGSDQVHELEERRDDVTRVSEATANPQILMDQIDPALLTTLSSAWSADLNTRSDLLGHVGQITDQLTGAVRVESGSSVLLINHSGDLPVTIANDLPVPAQVAVALEPQDPRLRAGTPVQATLDPETITTVRVPIEAVANGNVELDVQVLDTPAGEAVGESASFMVRVRADWEDIGTAVVAGLLVITFTFGLVRTIRSGKRRFPPEGAVPAEGGDGR